MIKYILSNSRIEIIDKLQLGIPTLYIQITVSENSGLCISNTKLMVYEYIKNRNNRNWGDFVYYNTMGVQSNIFAFICLLCMCISYQKTLKRKKPRALEKRLPNRFGRRSQSLDQKWASKNKNPWMSQRGWCGKQQLGRK